LTLVPPPPPSAPQAFTSSESGLVTPTTSMPGFEPLPSEAPVMQVPVPEKLLAEATSARLPIDLPALLRTLEDTYIAAALQQAGGNRKAAADLLGLQRTTLVEKLRRRARESQAA
jgi:sigma-54 specific flagellar transcriptional regulator A